MDCLYFIAMATDASGTHSLPPLRIAFGFTLYSLLSLTLLLSIPWPILFFFLIIPLSLTLDSCMLLSLTFHRIPVAASAPSIDP